MKSNQQLLQAQFIIRACLKAHALLNHRTLPSLIWETLAQEFKQENMPAEKLNELFHTFGYRNESTATQASFLCFNHIIVLAGSQSVIDDELRLGMYDLLEINRKSMGILVTFGGPRLLAERVYQPVHEPYAEKMF